MFERLKRLFRPKPEVPLFVSALPDGVQRIEEFQHPTGGDALRYHFTDGRVAEVCAACGGNCGQCGTSLGRDYPAQMAFLIARLERDSR